MDTPTICGEQSKLVVHVMQDLVPLLRSAGACSLKKGSRRRSIGVNFLISEVLQNSWSLLHKLTYLSDRVQYHLSLQIHPLDEGWLQLEKESGGCKRICGYIIRALI